MIHPSPGRVVWYRPKADEVGEAGLTLDASQPLAAIVSFVHSSLEVNLGVFGQRGDSHGRQNVELVQDEREVPPGACGWMPYQKGQAAKAEQLEQKIAEKPPAPVPVPAPAPEPEKPAAPVAAPIADEPGPSDPQASPSALDQLAQPQG